MKLTNNTIMITGGTSGIGLAFALRLLDMGNRVIVVGRNQAKIDNVLSLHPGLEAIRADISQTADVTALTNQLERDYPDLNLIINSAGIMRQYDLFDPEIALSDLTSEVTTNLNGIIYVTKSLLPLLSRQPEAMIVNISSLLSLVSAADSPVYSATKAGIHMYTDALREQVKANHVNIHIVELLPPLVTGTNLTQQYDKTFLDKFASSTTTQLVNVGIRGMQKNKPQIDAGFTKFMRVSMHLVPRQVTHIWGQQTMTAFLKKHKLLHA